MGTFVGTGNGPPLTLGFKAVQLEMPIEKLVFAFALSQIGVPSLAWREAFACMGGFCVGGTTWTRLTVLARADPPVRAG
ncbi:hypothetical protein ACVIHF_000901 [Bradyrhizobium sp. USDA 4506]